MVAPDDFMHETTPRFLLRMLRRLAPSLIISVVCTLVLYNLLRPHFAPSSVMPLLVASLFPLLGTAMSVVRHRRVDIFGVIVLIGLGAGAIGALLGGGQRLVLIRESFATGAIGWACLASLLMPKPLGYYFARQLLAADASGERAWFGVLWDEGAFRRSIRLGTTFWGLLLVGDFALAIIFALTLPIVVVLAALPVVLTGVRFAGVAISLIQGRRLLRPLLSSLRPGLDRVPSSPPQSWMDMERMPR